MSDKNICFELSETIRRNKISTTEVCDIMNKTGSLEGVYPVGKGMYAAGQVKYVYAHSESNYHLHEQLANIEEDKIIFVDAIECEGRAVFGDLVSKYLLLYRNARAIVTNGMMRDANDLIKQNRNVWCAGFTPIGCHNVSVSVPDNIASLVEERKREFESAILVCDDSGVAMITDDWINSNLASRLDFIELQEDIWYYCIDTLKWTTYETVALKRYLDESEVLPPILRKRLLAHDFN